MMTFITALAAFVTMAQSVVDDVNFLEIADHVRENRESSKQRIALIDQTIKEDFDHGINLSRSDNQKKIYKKLGGRMRLKSDAALLVIDYDRIRNTAIMMMEDEFQKYDAKAIRKKLYDNAAVKYKLMSEGDTVTIFYRSCGKVISATGKLHHINLYKDVTVDNTVISFVDMDDIQQQLFVSKSVEMLREKYVNSHFKAWEMHYIAKQKDYLRRQYAALLNQAFEINEKNGYIYNCREKKWWSPQFTIRRYLDTYAGKQKVIMKKRINDALSDLGIDED